VEEVDGARSAADQALEYKLTRELKAKAKDIRRNVLRMARGKGEGYVGQGLGAADILAAVYFHAMRYDPTRPDWPEHDRFLLSTGHYAIVLYATLTTLGMFPDEQLDTYGADNSPFGMSTSDHTPGVEITGGSLGQGLPVAVGMALGARLSSRGFRVFNFLSDGELQEGATWEAAMAAAHYKLSNLTALVDVNHVQADGPVDDVMTVEPIAEKWRAFGWHAQSLDGNSIGKLVTALDAAREVAHRPQVLVCTTLMGKGIPFIEQRPRGHFVRVETGEWDLALAQLEQNEL
jgi:transketolase